MGLDSVIFLIRLKLWPKSPVTQLLILFLIADVVHLHL